jgi:polyhydroxybutyrate depolymerase
VAVAAVASACAGGKPAANGSSSTTSSTPVGGACGHSVASGSTTLSLSIGGRTRVVIVHVPTGYSGTSRLPLVLNLHGSGSTASAQEAFSGMDAASDRYGFIAAYPQALIKAGTGFDWNIPGVPLLGGSYPPPGSADDVAFLTDLVGQLASRYCIDASRVYATGVSGGGRMSSQLACDASSTFAAVAPVAGLRMPSPCPSNRPVAVVAFHGTADPIDPYDGHGQAYWTYSVPVAARRWGTFDHCRPSPAVASGSGYTLTDYSGCAGGVSVELYSLIGEGHEWPGGPRLPRSIRSVLGAQSQAVDANAVMWAFFEEHTLP